MSEISSHKKEKRRSTSSSSYSSTSSESSDERNSRSVDKSKEKPQSSNTLTNMSKMKLDIGYKIQQEDLSDSDDSDISPTHILTVTKSSLSSISKNEDKEKIRDYEKRTYRSESREKRIDRSCSRDSRNDRSKSKDIKLDTISKDISSYDRKNRSRSREKKRERSRSRDKQKRSRSKEGKPSRSPCKEKKKDRSRSRERRRDRSRSRERKVSDRKEKRKERSRSREKYKKRSHRDSRSPSYRSKDKSRSHSKKESSRDRSSRRSKSRSRSRSRPRKRSRSRSRSFERSKRLYDKKMNKLCILEKLGIELKVPEGQTGEAGSNSGFSVPSYYNPAGVNPLKYAQQMQKRRLIWGNKKQEGEATAEKKEEPTAAPKPDTGGPESVWTGTTFSQDQDGKLTAKFKRLMGIKDTGEQSTSGKNSELIQKQEEMFSSMEKQYEVARVSTHTHRGLGLGFGVHLPR